MSFKHQPGLFEKTTEKARVLSQEPQFKNSKDIQFVENEYKLASASVLNLKLQFEQTKQILLVTQLSLLSFLVRHS